MRAVLLPGMNGTGELLTEFAAALAPEFDATVVAYPRDAALDYAALTELAAASLPRDEPFLLIAESFSGPIAIELAARKPGNLIGLVLCASFARAPQSRRSIWLRRLQSAVPVSKLPIAATMPMLMGRWSSPEWRRRVREAVRAVSDEAMRERLRAAASVDVVARIADIECPLLYLKASRDRLVSADSWREIRELSRNAVCIEIEGPHFLLQAQPQACAAAIK